MKELSFPQAGERCFSETLPNGLTVYVFPKNGFSKMHALLAVHYGGSDLHFASNGRWQQAPAGTAHFLCRLLQSEGQEKIDAFTTADMTGFCVTASEEPYERLKELLRAVTLTDFTAEQMETTRAGLAQELLAQETNPVWRARQQMLEGLYPDHLVHTPVMGTIDDLAQITPEQLSRCHKAFYDAANMVLCVAGDVEARKVFQLAEMCIPASAQKTLERNRGTNETPESGSQEQKTEMDVSAPHFALGFKADVEPSLRWRIVGELAALLLAGKSSPLHQRLCADGLICGDFAAGFAMENDLPHFVFSGTSPAPERVAEEIMNEAIRISWSGMDEALFQRVFRSLYGQSLQALDSFDQLCLGQARGHFAGENYLNFPALFAEVTKQEVEELLRESVTGVRSCLSIVSPEGV